MNYIDIAFIALLALSLIFGLIGKAPKKIFRTIASCGAVVFTWIILGKYTEQILQMEISTFGIEDIGTVQEYLIEKIRSVDILNTLYATNSSFRSLADNLPRVLVNIVLFFAIGLASILAFRLVISIIVGIIAKKKGTAKYTIGIFGLINGFIFTVVLLSPIMLLSPVLKKANDIYGLLDKQTEEVQKVVDIVDTQMNSSKVIEISDKLLTKYHVTFMEYEKENSTTAYMYDDFSDLSNMVAMVGVFKDMSDVSNMNPDDIRELFKNLEDSELAKDMVGGVIEDFGIEGVDLSTIDLSKEGEAVASIVEVMQKDVSEITDEEIDNLVGELAKSELVEAIADGNEGLLSDLDQSTQDSIKAELESQLNDPNNTDMDQEKYDTLMKLFGNK